MSKVYFIGDLHFGHKNIVNIRSDFKSSYEHDEFLVETWNQKVKKNDLVYVLGDVAFNVEGLEKVRRLNGRKILVRGNHDEENIHRYLVFFADVVGIRAYKDETGRYWLSHCPIHPDERRGRENIHGHVHFHHVSRQLKNDDGVLIDEWERDPWYLNVSAEVVDYEPKTTKEIRDKYEPIIQEVPVEAPKLHANKYGSIQQFSGAYKWVPTPEVASEGGAAIFSNTSQPPEVSE